MVTGCRWGDYVEPKEAEHKTEVGSMSRRKTKKQKQQIVKYESSNTSQEQMIEIQAEAYYRALNVLKMKSLKKMNKSRKYQRKNGMKEFCFS